MAKEIIRCLSGSALLPSAVTVEFVLLPPRQQKVHGDGERTEEKLVHCWGDRARNFKTAAPPPMIPLQVCVLLRVVYDSYQFFSDF